MADKIKEFVKVIKELNKLTIALIELTGTITLLILAVRSIMEIL